MTGFTKSRLASVYHGGFLLFISKVKEALKWGNIKNLLLKLTKDLESI